MAVSPFPLLMHQTKKKYLILLYDNTLDGLLSSIFDVYRLQLEDFDIFIEKHYHHQLFQPILKIRTNKAKANRIKIGLKRKTKQNLLPHLQTIFNQQPNREKAIFQLIHKTFYPQLIDSTLYHTIGT